MAMSRDLRVIPVTASTTQTAAGSYTAVANGDVVVATVANASDAVGIPANLPVGTVIYIQGGANAGTLWPPLGGKINAAAIDASVPLAATPAVTIVVVLTSGSASAYSASKTAAV